MHGTYAVVPTRDRRELLLGAVGSVAGQVDATLIIDHRSAEPLVSGDFWPGDRVVILRRHDDPVNLSRLWNVGLSWAAAMAETCGYETWDVVVLNDDVRVPYSWVKNLSTAMRSTTAVLASGGDVTELLLKTEPDDDIHHRLQGWAWVLRGESGLRVDEAFLWWFGDTDLDWQARQAGGTLLVPGDPVVHVDPNGHTERSHDLRVQAGRDRVTFARKWGHAPW